MKRVIALFAIIIAIGLAILIPASSESLMFLESSREWHRVRAEGDAVVAEYLFSINGNQYYITDSKNGVRRWYDDQLRFLFEQVYTY